MLWQVLSVANAAAHGIAAGVLMGVDAGIGRRQQAAGSSSGGAASQPWALNPKLAAAAPAASTLVEALVQLDTDAYAPLH